MSRRRVGDRLGGQAGPRQTGRVLGGRVTPGSQSRPTDPNMSRRTSLGCDRGVVGSSDRPRNERLFLYANLGRLSSHIPS